jgi:hypothetical protein
MLKIEHLRIYYRYDGDIDAWARSGSRHEKEIMTDEYWSLIDNFQQDLELIRNGLASKKYESEVMDRLNKLANSETQRHLIEKKRPKSKSLIKRLFN